MQIESNHQSKVVRQKADHMWQMALDLQRDVSSTVEQNRERGLVGGEFLCDESDLL